jgi:tRNA dimethylallyltransferase
MRWWQSRPRDELSGYRWLKMGIAVPRPLLYERINRRVTEMFDVGFVEEVRKLLELYPRHCQAFKAIGYRQIAAHLEGRITLEQAIEETRQESRRYAKRQVTWFHSDPSIVWLDGSGDADGLLKEAARLTEGFLAIQRGAL